MPNWLQTLLVGLTIAGFSTAIGALIAIGKLLQRIKQLEGIHTGFAHRSPDWEGEVRRRLETIDSSVEKLRTKSEEDREWLIKKVGEIQVDLARLGHVGK